MDRILIARLLRRSSARSFLNRVDTLGRHARACPSLNRLDAHRAVFQNVQGEAAAVKQGHADNSACAHLGRKHHKPLPMPVDDYLEAAEPRFISIGKSKSVCEKYVVPTSVGLFFKAMPH